MPDQTPSKDAVETAARRQFERDDLGSDSPQTWEDAKDSMREEYREDAECALEAALPHLRAQVLGEVEERLRPALDLARELAERVNQELGDYPAYSSAEDTIQEAEGTLKDSD